MVHTYLFSFWCLYSFVSVFGFQSQINFTKPHIIITPGYPQPYPSFSCTWTWSKPNGVWAIMFEDFNIDCSDTVYIIDISSPTSKPKTRPLGCSHNHLVPLYTTGSQMKILFTSRVNNDKSRGFKLQILSGRNLDDLKSQVYDLNQKEKSTEDKDKNYIYILVFVLLAMLVVILLLLGFWLVISRRRRLRTPGTVSVDVSVNHIQKASCVVYKKSASTSDPVESNDTTRTTTTVNVNNKRVELVRSPSQRSWATRAEALTSKPKNKTAVNNLYCRMGNY